MIFIKTHDGVWLNAKYISMVYVDSYDKNIRPNIFTTIGYVVNVRVKGLAYMVSGIFKTKGAAQAEAASITRAVCKKSIGMIDRFNGRDKINDDE